jgi:hypothetical protein
VELLKHQPRLPHRLPARQTIKAIDHPYQVLQVELHRVTTKFMTHLHILALSMTKETKFFAKMDTNPVVVHVTLPNSTAVSVVL